MIPRTIFSDEHNAFRDTCRKFIAEEIAPNEEKWAAQQHVDRGIWNRAGEMGMLCMTMPEEYGGQGVDRLFSAVLMEELAYAGVSSIGWPVHSDIVANYINNFGSEDQKRDWLPGMASGDIVGAIAMTEPGTGSDLQGIRTTAKRDGDHYILNGSKIFITNGYLSDMVVVAARTGDSGEGFKDISLLIVDAKSEGFSKAKPLKKIGMHGQDTCELFFDNVRVPKQNLLGAEGMGFVALMKELPWERLIIAILAVAGAESVLKTTLEYTKDRKVFGKPVASFQNSRFKLAEIKTEITLGRVFVDRCLELQLQNKLSVEEAAMAKYWTADMVCKAIDECLQLHGGYGYMMEYPIARAYIDSRAHRIYGGTNEIMKELISRSL